MWFWWAANKNSDPSSDLCHRTEPLFFSWESLVGLCCSKPFSTLTSCFLETVYFSFHCPNCQNLLYSLPFLFFFCLKSSQYFPKLLPFLQYLTNNNQHILWSLPTFDLEFARHEEGLPSYHRWQIYQTGHHCGTWFLSFQPLVSVSSSGCCLTIKPMKQILRFCFKRTPLPAPTNVAKTKT